MKKLVKGTKRPRMEVTIDVSERRLSEQPQYVVYCLVDDANQSRVAAW